MHTHIIHTLPTCMYVCMYVLGGPRGVMVKVQDCGIVVSVFELQFTFRQIPLGKVGMG